MTVLAYPNFNDVPDEIKITALKYAYTYIVQELLRLEHNKATATLTGNTLRDFIDNWLEPRNRIVTADLLELRQLIKEYVIQFKDKIDLEAILD